MVVAITARNCRVYTPAAADMRCTFVLTMINKIKQTK